MTLNGKRYTYLHDYFLSRFNFKVRKIALNIGFSCPNRDGTKGRGGCIFCSAKGSATRNNERAVSIRSQVEKGRAFFKKRYSNEGYIAYFQAFTSTYGPLEVLAQALDEIALTPDIIGFALSTRPDCVDEKVVRLVREKAKKFKIYWLELGLQTIHEKSYAWMERHDKVSSFTHAAGLLAAAQIPVVAHCILGFPMEDEDDILETARFLSGIKIWGVKIHQLHAIPGTRLWKLFQQGRFQHLTLDEYLLLVSKFMENLHPDLVIHRLVADHQGETMLLSSKNDTKGIKKELFLELLQAKLSEWDSYQGKAFLSN